MSFLFEQAGVQKKLEEAGLWYATAQMCIRDRNIIIRVVPLIMVNLRGSIHWVIPISWIGVLDILMPIGIWCILWGRTALAAAEYPTGTELTLTGRLQSRTYLKNLGLSLIHI